MNWDIIEGQWHELKGEVLHRWGKLTSDEVDQIAGQREKLEGALQKAYGKTREEAQREVEQWTTDYTKP